MALFKCKMCGGTLEIGENDTVAICGYCGTKQTLPKLQDDRRADLYDRANRFRLDNEFDKAMGIYETILDEDMTDAEAYWSLVLCRYGIEYVQDPATHRRVPTVNRSQYTAVFDDTNYKSALQYADVHQRRLYEAEAKEINEIQKGILAISQREDPFDVFICYKETDNNGRRTLDSVLANELYHQLTDEGFKVFFSRITLEDKLGTAYEPYIFAALNSAKVMVVLGTKAEYFNAVWVKNEWGRYLSLIKQGRKKTLIPAYKDMDPYELPEEFSHLQAQDMSKLGFMQDLIRGIRKIVQGSADKAVPSSVSPMPTVIANIDALSKRAFMSLEDGEFSRADEFGEQILNQDAENALAYLAKLMAELQVRRQEELKDCKEPFDNRNLYQKVLRFAEPSLRETLIGYNEHIRSRNEAGRCEEIYIRAKMLVKEERNEAALRKAAKLFAGIREYKDSEELVRKCMNGAEVLRKNTAYENGLRYMQTPLAGNYELAAKLFESISGWKDADEKAAVCRRAMEELRAQSVEVHFQSDNDVQTGVVEKKPPISKEKLRMIVGLAVAAVGILMVAIAFINMVIVPEIRYNNACALLEEGKYEEAALAFKELSGYKDSANRIDICLEEMSRAYEQESSILYFEF